MKDCQHVEEDKVLVAERQLFVVAKVAQENAAQVGVQVLRPVVYILHGNTIFSSFCPYDNHLILLWVCPN